MKLAVETAELERAAAALNGAGQRVRDEWAVIAEDIGSQAEGYIVKEFRSGPTAATTTQVRSNRLRRAYGHRVRRGESFVDTDIGLIRTGADSRVLGYGALMEGFNADGSRFTEKKIRAKGGGNLTFPIYDPNTPGVAQGNIIAWVSKKEVTFRPRPSFDAAILKFTPIAQREAADALARVTGNLT